MATVSSDPGSFHPDTVFYNVDIDAVTASTATTYSWDTWTTPTSGVSESAVTLLGSFTYDAFNTPSGSVAQILLDTEADGDTDVTIAFTALVSGILSDLISEDLSLFMGRHSPRMIP